MFIRNIYLWLHKFKKYCSELGDIYCFIHFFIKWCCLNFCSDHYCHSYFTFYRNFMVCKSWLLLFEITQFSLQDIFIRKDIHIIYVCIAFNQLSNTAFSIIPVIGNFLLVLNRIEQIFMHEFLRKLNPYLCIYFYQRLCYFTFFKFFFKYAYFEVLYLVVLLKI